MSAVLLSRYTRAVYRFTLAWAAGVGAGLAAWLPVPGTASTRVPVVGAAAAAVVLGVQQAGVVAVGRSGVWPVPPRVWRRNGVLVVAAIETCFAGALAAVVLRPARVGVVFALTLAGLVAAAVFLRVGVAQFEAHEREVGLS